MKKQLSILVTASTYPRWNGDDTPSFVQQYAERMATVGYDTSVLAPHADGAQTDEHRKGVDVRRFRYFWPASAQTVAYGGGAVYKIRATPAYALKIIAFIVSQAFWTVRLTLSRDIRVVNPHWIIPQGFVAVLSKYCTRRSVVLTVHGGDIFNLTGGVLTSVKRFVLARCDVVCVNSSATRDACRVVLDREYEIIPMGIDMARFAQKRHTVMSRRDDKGISIVFVGRLAPVKGVNYLLEALRLLHESEKKFTAVIVGDGPLKNDYIQFVSEHDLAQYVSFPGWVDQDELAQYYQAADVFVGPSLSEPQGLVFIEALASGVPVIASRVGGIVDIVRDGETGFLVDAGSAEAIAEKLTVLIDDPGMLRRFGRTARQSVEDRFSWERTIEQYDRIMKALS